MVSRPGLGPARSTRWCALLGLAVAVAAVTVQAVSSARMVDNGTVVLVAVGVAGVAWWGASRDGARARVPRLLALAVTFWSLGTLGEQVRSWDGWASKSGLAITDVAWLGFYAASGVAMWQLIRARNVRGIRRDRMIDAAVIFVVVMFVQWEVVLSGTLHTGHFSVWVRLLWALGSAVDAGVVAVALRAFVARRVNPTLAMMLAISAVIRLQSCLAYSGSSSARPSAWLVLGWQVGAMLLAASAWQPIASPTRVERVVDDADDRVGRWQVALGLTPLLIPGLFEIIGYARHEDPNPIPLVAGSWVLVGLAFLRAWRALRLQSTARARVRSQERYAHAVAANSSDAVVLADARGTIMNDAFELAAMLGHHNHGFRGVDGFTLVAPDDVETVRATFERIMAAPQEPHTIDVGLLHFDGSRVWASVRLVNLLGDPDVRGVLVVIHDVSVRKRMEDQLTHQAFHDGLTGLPNRTLLVERLEQALRRNTRDGHFVAVVFVDLDGFKSVNDSLGHLAGDELLCEAAARLAGCVRDGDTVARLGGDEFAILIERSLRPVPEAEAVADRVLQALSTPISVGERRVTVLASMGIAAGDVDASAASLLRDADVAMYRAKAAGKARWTVYDAEMRVAADERLQLESDLLAAIDDHQFRLVYQPVVELATGQIVGFEALIRWDHPAMGEISPDRFIPIAEENGLVVPIGRWALTHACETLARWHHDHPHLARITMAVNVSARQIGGPDLQRDVAAVLQRTGLDPTTLVLEMTETAFVHDPAHACTTLRGLRDLGVRLAVDDFGTGYSSLGYLRQFPMDILKIDRSFVKAITDRDEVPAIVRGLIDLGRTLDLEMIAEGVELPVQRDRLRDERCQLAQGFLFAEPLDVDVAEQLVLDGRPVERAPVQSVE